MNESINQLINQSINQSVNQSINQSKPDITQPQLPSHPRSPTDRQITTSQLTQHSNSVWPSE